MRNGTGENGRKISGSDSDGHTHDKLNREATTATAVSTANASANAIREGNGTSGATVATICKHAAALQNLSPYSINHADMARSKE